jgi:hypothetical protein
MMTAKGVLRLRAQDREGVNGQESFRILLDAMLDLTQLVE